MAWRPYTPNRLLGAGLAGDSLGGIFRHIVPGRDCQNRWGQGCTGGWGREKGDGPQGAWKLAGRGRPEPAPLDLHAAQGGEGQATFFVDAGILTSDFPCSAWGRSPAQRAWAGREPRLPCPRMPAARGPRREGSAGLAWPCPWAQAAGAWMSAICPTTFSSQLWALLSHVGAGLGTLKIASG